MPPKPHLRVVYDDLERLRADVRALLDQGAHIIDWLHIWERGHDIDEPQVSRALRAGEYYESRFRGRYLAEYEEHDERESGSSSRFGRKRPVSAWWSSPPTPWRTSE